MSNTWTICKRECNAYFTTPVGYVVIGTFALISGLSFTASFLIYGVMSETPTNYDMVAIPDFEETFLSPYLVYCGLIMLFIGPLVTMRLLAEEHNQGTIEMLYTHPIRDREIVFGKYLASLFILVLMMGIIWINLGIVYYFVEIEPAVLIFGLFTFFLMGAAFMSMGLFISSLCKSQITAATLTFGMFFVLFMMSFYSHKMSEENPAPEGWSESAKETTGQAYNIVRAIVLELPIDAHAKEMAQGVVQPKDIAYYILFSIFFLFLTFRSLESRKWRIRR
jgi:ABC-2 type transport system permease protein